jgi:hypothetical protein
MLCRRNLLLRRANRGGLSAARHDIDTRNESKRCIVELGERSRIFEEKRCSIDDVPKIDCDRLLHLTRVVVVMRIPQNVP